MSKSRSSSLEQGEIGATPDFNVSPHIDLDIVSETDLRREKERKRKREEHENIEETEDILRIKPPQAKSSAYEEDNYKRFRRADDRNEEKSKKKYESDRLERLERERKRLDNERHRHLDKIQRERDYERELARKEKSCRAEDERRREDRRDSRRTAKSSHSVDYRKSRNEVKETRSMATRDPASPSPLPSPRPRKEEKRHEHRRRERRSPMEEVIVGRFTNKDKKREENMEVEEDVSKQDNEVEKMAEVEEIQEAQSKAPETPSSSIEKGQDSPKYDRYHLARSKFDVDDEEEDGEKSSTTRNNGDSHGRSPSLERQDVSPNPDDIFEENDAPIKTESLQNTEEEDDIVEEVNTPVLPVVPSEDESSLPSYYPAIQGCRSVEEFHCLNKINEGTYGVVYRAVDLKLREIVALKRLKLEKEKDGFPITSLREIKLLMMARHPNVVTIKEVVVGSNLDKVYMVMEYVEHDMKSLMESMKEPFTIGEVKTLMIQLLRGVQHLHDNWIIHRDLKTSNLLLSHSGILKIADFGLAREYGSPLKPYTPIVVTLWYRSPELLLGTKMYSTAVDMWSVGCIFAEFLLRKPVFVGKTEIDQLNRIFKILGSPSEGIWPGVNDLPMMQKNTFTQHSYNQLRKKFEPCLLSEKGFQMMNNLLTYCPEKRMTAESALIHDYFNETPLPTHPSMFPTWPAKSELFKTMKSPKAPTGGKAIPKLSNDKDLTKRNMPPQGFFFKFY